MTLPARTIWLPLVAITLLACGAASLSAAEEEAEPAPAAARRVSQEKIDLAIEKGIEFLLRTQAVDGSWRGPFVESFRSGMTALAVYTLLRCGVDREHPAVRKGLAYMTTKTVEKTYAAGANLQAYQAVREGRPASRVRTITKFLVESMGTERWSYPRDANDFFDLSNTQYALLGLRAAAAMGERIPSDVWKHATQGLMKTQKDDGGWKYREGHGRVNAGMTVAGICALRICADALEKKNKSLARRTERHINRAYEWLEGHWSVEKNTSLAESDATADRWYFYYLYGLERIGSLGGPARIGEHDWYEEGADVLIRKQRKNGAWGTAWGDEDCNTCFALLFLRRGTRSSSLDPRSAVKRASEDDTAFRIGTNVGNPLAAWVRKRNEPVLARLEKGQRVAVVDWFLDGRLVGSVTPKKGSDGSYDDFLLEHEIEANGTHDVRAVMRFESADGSRTGSLESDLVRYRVDSVETPADREVIVDTGENRLTDRELTITASTNRSGDSPERAFDGNGSTQWICDDDDESPWLRVELDRPVRIRSVKLTPARSYYGHATELSRPKEIVLVLNGSRKITVALDDDVERKHGIALDATNVRTLGLRIASRYPGTKHRERVGVSELELFTRPIEAAGTNGAVSDDTEGIHFGFESGDSQGFRLIEGEAGRLIGSRTRYFHSDALYEHRGRFYMTSHENAGGGRTDAQLFVARSPLFVLNEPRVTFLVGGGKGDATGVALCKSDGTIVKKADGENREGLREVTWDLPELVGETLYLDVIDRSVSSWGYVVFDDFRAQGRLVAE